MTYTPELDGRFVAVQHVPAHVRRGTGEQLFSPENVNRLQAIIRSRHKPTRVIETAVYEFPRRRRETSCPEQMLRGMRS